MDALIAFVVAAWISFIGSILLGMVNVAVIDTAIRKGSKHAVFLAVGGILPEIPYTLLAIFGTSYVDLLKAYQQQIGVGVGAVFILLGLYYLIRHMGKVAHPEGIDKQRSPMHSFVKGLILAFANPQLIFFWSGILILLQTGSLNVIATRDLMIDFNATTWISPKITFAIGAAVGALIILLIYVRMARVYREKLLTVIGERLSKIVGVIFVVLGAFAILKSLI